MKRAKKPTCRYCGSADLSADASVQWSTEINDWVITNVYDGGSCDDCGQEMKYFEWVDHVEYEEE